VLRLLVILALALGLAYLGSTVKLGKRTFFGHVRAIWHTEEAQDLKTGVEETAKPAVRRLEHGVKAGYEAIRNDDAGAGSAGSAERVERPRSEAPHAHAPAAEAP
jgi:hypothetical protein